jgi:hypothetical protein
MTKKQQHSLTMLQPTLHKTDRLHKTAGTPNISPITSKDKELLMQTLQKARSESMNYEDSWGYVIQAARYNGFKWYDEETNSLIFFGKKTRTDKSLVVPTFIAEPQYLCDVVGVVQKALKSPRIILKNVTVEDVDKYKSCHFREYKEHENWNDFAKYDDQTFPQSIVDLKKVVELQGKGYHHLRKTLRKDPEAVFRKYRESDLESVLEVFAIRDGKTLKSPGLDKGMYYASHVMYPYADMEKYVIIDKKTEKVLGFTATSAITSKTAAFVTLLFLPEVKVGSVWGIHQTLIATYKLGYETINFGGSESLGTDVFVKRNFQPVAQIKKTHLIYDPK